MVITLRRRSINFFYLLILSIDLFFIAVLLYDAQHQPPQMEATSYFWFSKVDLKNESNLATWYSSLILFITGCLAFLNLNVNTYASRLKWLYRIGWTFIGGLLFMLSADESAVIHESIATMAYLEKSNSTRQDITVGAGDWIPFLLPFIIAAVVGLLSFIVFSFFKCKKVMLLGLAGVFCWIASIAGEAIEGKFINIAMSRAFEGLLEESMEVIGTTLLLIAFAEHYQWRQKFMAGELEKGSPEPSISTAEAQRPVVD